MTEQTIAEKKQERAKRSTYQEPTEETVAVMAAEAADAARAATQATIRRDIPTTESAPDPAKEQTTKEDCRDPDIAARDLYDCWSADDIDGFDSDQRRIYQWGIATDAARFEALDLMTFGSAEEMVRVSGEIADEHDRRARQARNLQRDIADRMAAQHQRLLPVAR